MKWLLAVVALALACGSSGSQPANPESRPAPGGDESGQGGDEQAQIAAIEKALGERGPAIYACRSRATADDLELDGKLRLELTMGAAAVVTEVEVLEDTVGDEVLTECMTKIWNGYSFDAVFSPGDVALLPPFEFVSEGVQYVVNAGNVKPVEQGGVTVSPILTEANTGNTSADLKMIVVSDGGTMKQPLVENEATATLVFVGGGELRRPNVRQIVKTPKGDRRTARVSTGSAVYSRGASYELVDEEDDNPTVLFQFAVPARGKKIWRVYTRNQQDAEVLSIAGGKANVRLYFDRSVTTDESAYLGVFTAEPGAVVPEHTHGSETEMLFVFSGEARMTVDGKPFPVGKGDAIQVPPKTLHAAEVTGKEPFQAIQVYTPSGPEQRFKPTE